MKTLSLLAALMLVAGPAMAGTVTLKPNPVDDDGRVTLGDIFDNAGSAANVQVASRAGPSVVLEAGQLQGIALRSGLQWANPQGLRRVVVRQGVGTSTGTGSSSGVQTASTNAVTARPGAALEILTYARNLSAGDIVQPEDVVWGQVQAHQAPSGAPSDADQVIGLSAKRALRAGTAVATRDLTSPQVIARNDMVQVSFVTGGVKLTVTGRATRNASIGEAVPILNVQSGRTIDAVASGPGQAIAGPAARNARSPLTQFAAR